MSYIGNQPTTVAFLTDQFSGTGSQTAFTLSAAPANTASIIVAVSGVLQDPTTYSVSGLTLTFSAAPPAGTGNISVRFLGIPASGVTTTAYRTVTEFTATAGQTTFTPPSYTVGYINVYRNGALLGTADYTATNGTTVVLANPASLSDLVVVESFYVSSVLNAVPAQNNAVIDNYILSMAGSKLTGSQSIPSAALPVGSVLQVVNATFTNATQVTTSSTSPISTALTLSITPKFASSKILVMANTQIVNQATGVYAGIGIYRNGSTSLGFNSYVYGASSVTWTPATNISYDSPATTSATTYTVYFLTSGGSASIFWGSGGTSTITAMEIAA